MTRFLMSTVALTAVYLLVLTSLHPGDVLVGAILSAAIAATATVGRPAPGSGPSLLRRLAAAPRFVLGTLAEMVRGNWHVALYVLGGRRLETPGLVLIPRAGRSSSGVAVWGYVTAISPDEIVVEADDERGILLVHLLDARDVSAIRDRHQRTYERRQRAVFP
jgi:multisubunit Na+/H+ antiporter MnhE subunit